MSARTEEPDTGQKNGPETGVIKIKIKIEIKMRGRG